MKNIIYTIWFLCLICFSVSCTGDAPINCAEAQPVGLMGDVVKSGIDPYTFMHREDRNTIINQVHSNSEEPKEGCLPGIVTTVYFEHGLNYIPCLGKAIFFNDHLQEIILTPRTPADSSNLIKAVCEKENICLDNYIEYYSGVLQVYRAHESNGSFIIAWRDRCLYDTYEYYYKCLYGEEK